MPRLQRLLIIVAFVLVTVLLGILLYAVFFGPQVSEMGNGGQPGRPFGGPEGTTPTLGGTNARLPGGQPSPLPSPPGGPPTPPVSPVASGGVTETRLALEANAQSLTLDRDGTSLLYYNPADGRFYRLRSDGSTQALTDRVFHSVERITWSDDRQRAVLEYPDGANIIYDFTTGRQVSLPNHWEQFSFAPGGDQIVAKSIGLDPENRWLVTIDASGGRGRSIVPLGENARSVIPNWSPNGQMVAMQVETSGRDRQEVFFIGMNEEQFRSTLVPGWGFEGRWTPRGDQLFYSVYRGENGNRPELWLVDASPTTIGANRKPIGLQTWAHKCAFAGQTVVYCAVPASLPEGAGLFPKEMDAGLDSVYRVDLTAGTTSLVAQPDVPHTMGSLQVSSDGKYLYYTAKQDGNVYKIQLK